MAALPLQRDSAPRRATSAPRPSSSRSRRPDLAVVQRRRRWPALVAAGVWTLVVLGLLGAAVFHTQLAERQLRLDRLDREVTAERERFDDLRYQRAQLRSPVRLAEAAGALGMERGAATTFVSVSPEAVARQLATTGPIDDEVVHIVVHTDPLEQFQSVKSVTGEGP